LVVGFGSLLTGALFLGATYLAFHLAPGKEGVIKGVFYIWILGLVQVGLLIIIVGELVKAVNPWR